MRWWTKSASCFLLGIASVHAAGPVDFGNAELNGFFASIPPHSLVRTWAWQGSMAINYRTKQLDWGPLDRVFRAAAMHHDFLLVSLAGQASYPVRLAVPKAFIALTADNLPDRATALAIFQHCRANLAPFKRVRRLEFAELPKTISGKIRRVELREMEQKKKLGK